MIAATRTQFLEDPVGRYVLGNNYLVWCHGPTLQGTALWGLSSEEMADEIVRLWEFDKCPGVALPHDVVIDARHLESIDARGFEIVGRYLTQRMPGYAERVRREAIVTGSLLIGSVIAGLLTLTRPGFEWDTFTDVAKGFAWLDHPDAAAAGAEVEGILEQTRRQSETVRALRQLLHAHDGALTLSQAARALARSPRSLQRQLSAAGTSYRDVLGGARVDVARRLLLETELKIEVIAQRLGYTSATHFAVAFCRRCGMTPGQFRAAARQRG